MGELTGARRSISVAGSWTALEGLAGCVGRQTVPDRPDRRRKRQREVNFELLWPKHLPKQATQTFLPVDQVKDGEEKKKGMKRRAKNHEN